MPIMAARVYHDGKLVRDIGPDEELPDDCAEGDFFWLGLYEPTPGELEGIAKRFGLHPLAVEDATKAKQLPKVEVYGDQLFIIASTGNLGGGTIQSGETAIFVGRHFIVTVRHGSARTHSEVRARLETLPAKLAHGPDYVLYAILDFIVDGYFPLIDAIEDRMLLVEDSVMDTPARRRRDPSALCAAPRSHSFPAAGRIDEGCRRTPRGRGRPAMHRPRGAPVFP